MNGLLRVVKPDVNDPGLQNWTQSLKKCKKEVGKIRI